MLKNLMNESDLRRFKQFIAEYSDQEYWENFIHNQFIALMDADKLYSLNIVVMREFRNNGYGITDYPVNIENRIPNVFNSKCLILFIREKDTNNQKYVILRREL